jgi:hypothetical protein
MKGRGGRREKEGEGGGRRGKEGEGGGRRGKEGEGGGRDIRVSTDALGIPIGVYGDEGTLKRTTRGDVRSLEIA